MRKNPFNPYNPVTPFSFHGRALEINKIVHSLFQARENKQSNFLIFGERGIGKSSLLIFTDYLASGRLQWTKEVGDFHFLSIQVNLDRNTTLLQLAKKIHATLDRTIYEEGQLKRVLAKCWDFLQRMEIQGIKLNEREVDEDLLIDQLTDSLINTTKEIVGHKYDGVVILIDEADNAENASLGTFLKNFSEKLVKQKCQCMAIGIAGLPKVRDILEADHPSSLRMFEPIELNVLQKNDVDRILEEALNSASKEEGNLFTITEGAKKLIFKYSEGHPYFVQQIGACCFDFLSDKLNQINESIVEQSFFDKSNGSLMKMGKIFYHSMYWTQIHDDKYREVLQIIADIGNNGWVKKSSIFGKFSGGKTALTNALSALTDRGIIDKDNTRIGLYKLHRLAFALWIKHFGEIVN